ncbi:MULTISPECIES: type II secretion system F family protein [Vibrio]|uniref:Pilus assembly protein TadB n=2 Tax=Vibrio TaxID=662 RepID=A0A0A5HZ26_PHOS4|nr:MULTISPECIES: type II secretion system F family protein [Vibrio]KGY09500.1 pilus assembly protein TadB [Vibrio sinaloensis]KHA60519.1 pilus assembly protein TadB [Vibrio variabilis]KHT40358.1 pilus assembly protein TadB [Vibrio sinaloensis]KHT52714.1 pilus assembly protein TadB [Vibrio sinaloensis]
MIFWLALILGGVLFIIAFWPSKRKENEYLEQLNRTLYVNSMDEDHKAVNLNSLTGETFRQKIQRRIRNIKMQLGAFALLKVLAYCLIVALVSFYANNTFIRVHPLYALVIGQIVGIFSGLTILESRQQKEFEMAFPDALNMLASAVSSGESLMHSIIFVGKSLEGSVGEEFKRMGERLQMGESPDTVFRKSCNRFPYRSFQFFVITLRANMQRGGQLKDVITRLNRLMFDARAIEKKKYALTSEARTSAKIVAAIPFFFLFMLQYLSPENYDFVMNHPKGQPILYYMLISEAIGISIVWGLMRGVR